MREGDNVSNLNDVDNHSHLHLNTLTGVYFMYVCICRQVTDNQIRELCREGVVDLQEIRAKLGVASECGSCGDLAQTIVQEFSSAAIKEFSNSTGFVNAG